MGKVWTRDGKSNQRETPASAKAPRFHTHRPTVWTRSAQQSQKAVPVSGHNGVPRAPVAEITWDDADGPAAKRRRLAAKGRLPPSLVTAQNGSAGSYPHPAVKEAAEGSEPQLPAWKAAKATKEAKREVALLQEAEALRRRIAEEEAKLAAAKVRLYNVLIAVRTEEKARSPVRVLHAGRSTETRSTTSCCAAGKAGGSRAAEEQARCRICRGDLSSPLVSTTCVCRQDPIGSSPSGASGCRPSRSRERPWLQTKRQRPPRQPTKRR